MKRLIIFIVIAAIVVGCSQAFPSPRVAFEKGASSFPNIAYTYYITCTDTEYIYISSTTNGAIIVFHIQKLPPHKVTKAAVLFYIHQFPRENS